MREERRRRKRIEMKQKNEMGGEDRRGQDRIGQVRSGQERKGREEKVKRYRNGESC